MKVSQSTGFARWLNTEKKSWIVFYTNITDGDHSRMNLSSRLGIVAYGSILTIVSIILHFILIMLLLLSIKFHRWKASNFLILQWSISSLSLALTTFPLTAVIERNDKWPFIDDELSCKSWLVMKIAFQAISTWTLVVIAVDKCVYAVQPVCYPKRMNGWKISALSVFALFFGCLATLPTIFNMQLEDSVLVEVCAIQMTKVYAVATAGLVYIIPGVGSLLGCISAVCLFTRARRYPPEQCCHHQPTSCDKDRCWLDVLHLELRQVRNSVCVTISVTAIYVFLWGPFWIFYLWLPFCDMDCLNPVAWSTLRWIGHSAATIVTSFWFMDLSIRQTVRIINLSRKSQYSKSTMTMVTGSIKTTDMVFDEDYSQIDEPFVAKTKLQPKNSNIRLGISGLNDIKF